jgi:hypothetical protein
MTNEELKRQVDKINKLIASGKTVDLRMTNHADSARLLVNKKKASPIPKGAAIDVNEELGVGDGSTAQTLNLNLTAEDFTDEQIVDKIKQASMFALALEVDDQSLPVVTLTHDDIKNEWILAADCSYTTSNHKVTAVEGFRTDLSSIPRIFWAILDPPELSLAAPLFHDLIYRCAGKLPSAFGRIDPGDGFVFVREQVDNLFLE